MARYWIVVGGPEIFGKTREMGFVRHGFKSTRRGMASAIGPGDHLVFYVTGKKQFAAIARVTTPMSEEHTRIWESAKKPSEMYPYRVGIEPEVVLDDARWVSAEAMHERMTWTQRWPKQHWTLAYQGNLHEIPEADFDLLKGEIERAKAGSPA